MVVVEETTFTDLTLGPDAVALLERAFAKWGGFNGALAEARWPTRGGLRAALDAMTDQLKTEQQAKYVSYVFKEAIDALDHDARAAFVAALLDRLRPDLPADLQEQPAERFVDHYEAIARAYVDSRDQVNGLLRAM